MIDRYRNYQPASYRRPPPRQPRHTGRKLFALILLSITLYFGYSYITKPETKQAVTTTVKKARPKAVKVDPISDTTWTEIQTSVDAIIDQYPDISIGASVIDSNTGRKVNFGFQEAYHGASTTKVLTAAAFLHQVEEGQYTLESQLSGRSAKEHLRLMLNRSNNDSWAALNAAVGHSALTQYAHDNGINSFNYIGNLMTPADQALLLYKVFKRQLVNNEHTSLMLSYMQNTNNEDMIPVVIPEGATFYHKYGQLDDRLHDGAIINYKNRPLIIVIYTKGGGNAYGEIYNKRITIIQTIAKAIITPFYSSL